MSRCDGNPARSVEEDGGGGGAARRRRGGPAGVAQDEAPPGAEPAAVLHASRVLRLRGSGGARARPRRRGRAAPAGGRPEDPSGRAAALGRGRGGQGGRVPRAARPGEREGSETAAGPVRQRAVQLRHRRAAASVHADEPGRAGRPPDRLGHLAHGGAAHRVPGAQAALRGRLLRVAGHVCLGRLSGTAGRAGPHGERVEGAPVSGIVRGDQVGQDLVLRPDVCVVGSGPGGAMMASRLAEAGAQVVVLEEGGYHQKDEFDMQEATAYPRLYQDRGNRATADLSIAVLQGRAVGGGTVVNWTTSFRTPDDVLGFWREKEGAVLDPAALRPHFEEIEKRLGISKVDLEEVNANNRALYDGCKKLGWAVDTTSRNVRGCLRTGYCGMGCPVDAKQSAVLTYLPDAVSHGATVHANCRVRRIEWSGKRATAVVGEVLHPGTQEQTGRTARVEPRAVVVSCGALNSPALLLRSGLAQGPVGKKTWLHPVVAMAALYRDPIEAFYGAPQSVASHHFAHREPAAGFFLEASPLHPMLAGIAFPGFGPAMTAQMSLLPFVSST